MRFHGDEPARRYWKTGVGDAYPSQIERDPSSQCFAGRFERRRAAADLGLRAVVVESVRYDAGETLAERQQAGDGNRRCGRPCEDRATIAVAGLPEPERGYRAPVFARRERFRFGLNGAPVLYSPLCERSSSTSSQPMGVNSPQSCGRPS
jgi:hypothetical protein